MRCVLNPEKLRVFVAAPRSGSTLFMRVMANCEEVAVTSRNVLMGNMLPRVPGQQRTFAPDYSIFDDCQHAVYQEANKQKKKIIISKEELGNDRYTGTDDLNECNYSIFPNDDSLLKSKPIFTFRNPNRVFDGWLKQGWYDIESFLLSYQTLIDTFERAKRLDPNTLFYTYKFMTGEELGPIKVFSTICHHWGLSFTPKMLHFDPDDFGQKFLYAREREKDIYHRQASASGLFNVLSTSNGVIHQIAEHNLLTNDHKKIIADAGLMEAYMDLHQECIRKFESVPKVINPNSLNPSTTFIFKHSEIRRKWSTLNI